MNMSGFEFGSVFGRHDKLTVHSNAVSSVATFDCPIGLVEQKPDGVCDYTHARIGFVQHSSKAESGVFEANGDVQTSTFTPIGGPGITRTQAFAGPFKLPLTIRVVELEPGSHVEITGIVLQKHGGRSVAIVSPTNARVPVEKETFQKRSWWGSLMVWFLKKY